MAQTYGCRPSELLGVEDPYSSWCLDEVTFTWGSTVDSSVERARSSVDDPAHGNDAATAELNRILSQPREKEQDEVEAPAPRGVFRDPVADFAAAKARAQGRP
jgi:hypothetical protein